MAKRIIWSGVLAGAAFLIAEMVVGFIFIRIFPQISAEYQNAGLFRPWSDPKMSLYFLHPFLVGIVLSWIWSRVKNSIMSFGAVEKGFNFGIAVFLAATIPGMLISYATFQVSFVMVASWAVGGLVALIVAGIIYAKLNP